jgi:hypothetical protein
MSPDDAPREHFSNLADPPWSIVAGGRVLGTGGTGTDAWRAVLATAEAERDALRARAEAAEAALVLACPHCGPEHFAGPDADGTCVMCMGALIRTDAAGAVLAHELYNGAHYAEAALATARAEGAAALLSDILAMLDKSAAHDRAEARRISGDDRDALDTRATVTELICTSLAAHFGGPVEGA